MQNEDCFSDTYLAPIKHIASGGMGDVFLANDTRLSRQVAVKRVTLTDSHDAHTIREQALYEARLMAKANHPNIVQLYDIVEVDSQLLLVLEYVPGQTLAKYVKQKFLTLTEKLAILEKVAHGLQYIHQLSLIHCDVKASNILISETGEVKLSDFGIANSLQSKVVGLPQSTSFGSIYAMSPEQLEGRTLSYATDIFSFGVLSFELLFGRHPFGSAKGEELASRIKRGALIEPEGLTPSIPTELTTLLRQMLDKSADKRPSTKEIINVLGRALSLLEAGESDDTASLPYTSETSRQFGSAGQVKRFAIGFILALFFVVGGYFSWLFLKPDSRIQYTLVLEPQITVEGKSGKENTGLLLATIDSAVRQVVLNSVNAELVNHKTYGDISDVESLVKASGATAILLPVVRCEITQCNVRLSLLKGDSQLVQGELNTSIKRDDYLAISSTYSAFAGKLLGQPNFKAREKLIKMEQTFFNQYLHVYHDVNFNGNFSLLNLQRTRALIEADPNYFPLYSLMMNLYIERYHVDRQEVYLEDLGKLLQAAPSSYKLTKSYIVDMTVFAIESKQDALVQAQLEQLYQFGETALSYRLRGYYLYSLHDLEGAIEMYTKSITLQSSVQSKYSLALAYFYNGQLDQAKAQLEEVERVFPNYTDAQKLSADLYMLEGSWALAIERYEATIAKTGSSADYSNLALAYLFSNQYQKALLAAERANTISPENMGIRLNYADLLYLNNEVERAEKEYLRIATNDISDATYSELLVTGQALAHLGRYEESLQRLYQAVKLTTDKLNYAYEAALIYTLAGELKSAIIHYKAAIDGGYALYWFDLPWFKPLCEYPEFKKQKLSICQSMGSWTANDERRVNH
ncbi:serine/threonine-protein kinase [Pseudoalteromonas luteoviolacea]|uniref:serine/threonine-protein kinase n=1 Tax=Pseudoalteromonas luteoviolacea TaxID=43657 RepID=UPI001B369DAF|nr:serine/threonine-protein kinase [Pseudoalteromonas luteoviolacea]MBQ4835372.1 protein kinase [Pseudoalteromonas luteoviolacea]